MGRTIKLLKPTSTIITVASRQSDFFQEAVNEKSVYSTPTIFAICPCNGAIVLHVQQVSSLEDITKSDGPVKNKYVPLRSTACLKVREKQKFEKLRMLFVQQSGTNVVVLSH